MSLQPHQIIYGPIISEETQIQQTKGAQYTFKVNPDANKIQIREALEYIFKKDEIKIVRVNTMNYQGKIKRQIGRHTGRRPKWKKAIVTLREGDTIELI